MEERGLLRDTESCISSANKITNLSGIITSGDKTSTSSPQPLDDDHWPSEIRSWTAQLPLGNGSSVPSQPDDDRLSDDSEGESIVDPEPDLEAGFTPEVYSTIITKLRYDLQREMDAQEYRRAENLYKEIVKHCIDRQTNLGIGFDDRSELNEILAEIYIHTRRYRKARRVLATLLKEESANTDRKWKLYLDLAAAYRGQNNLDKALANAQVSLKGLEILHPQDHPLVLQSALLLIDICERQGKTPTANVLRGIYCPDTLPPPPPKSVLRKTFQPPPPPPPPPSPPPPDTFGPSPTQISSEHHEENHYHVEHHVRWGPDVWPDDDGMNKIHESGKTSLIVAIHTGDEQYVRSLLDRGANVATPCADTIPPLFHAVTKGYPVIVQTLLERGAHVDIPISRWTALHQATEAGDLTMMRILLHHRADIEFKSPLKYVAPMSERAKLKAIANDEPDPEADTALLEPGQGWTPLLRAASKGNEAAVRLLLDCRANIEARNPHQATPLMCACENLHFAVVDLLLMSGADVHAFDEYGWHPIHRALVKSDPKINNTIAARLLDSEAEINARCNYDKTPLHYAVERADAPMVEFLVNKKADIEARDKADLTPLHTAIQCRHVSIVRLLLKLGADAMAMDSDKYDALATAQHAERKSPEIIDLLKNHKKQLKRRDSEAKKGHAPGSSKPRPSYGGKNEGRGSLGTGAATASSLNHASAESETSPTKSGKERRSLFGNFSGRGKLK